MASVPDESNMTGIPDRASGPEDMQESPSEFSPQNTVGSEAEAPKPDLSELQTDSDSGDDSLPLEDGNLPWLMAYDSSSEEDHEDAHANCLYPPHSRVRN